MKDLGRVRLAQVLGLYVVWMLFVAALDSAVLQGLPFCTAK